MPGFLPGIHARPRCQAYLPGIFWQICQAFMPGISKSVLLEAWSGNCPGFPSRGTSVARRAVPSEHLRCVAVPLEEEESWLSTRRKKKQGHTGPERGGSGDSGSGETRAHRFRTERIGRNQDTQVSETDVVPCSLNKEVSESDFPAGAQPLCVVRCLVITLVALRYP